MSDARGVQSIEVGARLLRALAKHSEPMMLRDVAASAGIAPAQAHAYMVSYLKSRLVEQDERTGRYRLGPFALTLALAKLRDFDPIGVSVRSARVLSEATGLSVAILVWGAYGPTVVQLVEGFGQVHMNTRPGAVYSLTGTATGWLFVHHMPRELIESTLRQQRTEAARSRLVGPVLDLRIIQDKLEFVGTNGYAITDSAPVPGISAISAPVFDISDQMSLALTLIGTDKSLNIGMESEHVAALLKAARGISAQLGWSGVSRT